MEQKWKEWLGKIKFVRSLRVRIFFIILVSGIASSLLMGYAVLRNYEERAVSLRTAVVQNQLLILANHLIHYDYLQSNTSETINAELEMLSNLYDGRVLIIGGDFKVVRDTYGVSDGKIMVSEEVIRCFQGESLSKYYPELGYIQITTPIKETVKVTTNSGEKETVVVRGAMLTSISNENIAAIKDVMKHNVFIMEVVLTFGIFAIAIAMSKAMTRPFERVTEAISAVKAGYTNENISVSDYTETIHIVDAFNQLLSRMRVLDESRQEFVSNVSHELKTPLTSMKVLADSLLTQPEAPAELYKEFLEDIAAEIDRENRIINDLLALVKMDKTAAELNITSVNMNELLELILKRLRPIARKRDVEIVFESIRPVMAEVDEVKITLAITNLVENAIKYNNEHGWVKVILDADHQEVLIEVTDSGIGIPEEALAHIYERFYRVDKSHSREIGGTGLGLSITRNVVLMHRGTISVSSTMGEGTCFKVAIPLNYIV
ncbi:MAG: two-component sensor histidine kinase [Lachnospiraceae bacterium]|nr:two-component sensor histidine kinase [Lachnospiraceae bacterium]